MAAAKLVGRFKLIFGWGGPVPPSSRWLMSLKCRLVVLVVSDLSNLAWQEC